MRLLQRPAVDLRDPASLRAALAGAEQLFLLTPHGPDQDLLEANAIDAAVAAGVRRVVKISGGAPSLGPNGPTSTAVAHWRSERRIEDSGRVSFCFLRPSFLMQNLNALRPRWGFLLAPMGHAPIAMVDARDVAACAVAAFLDGGDDSAWHVTGSAGVTFRDVGAALRQRPATAGREGAAPPRRVDLRGRPCHAAWPPTSPRAPTAPPPTRCAG